VNFNKAKPVADVVRSLLTLPRVKHEVNRTVLKISSFEIFKMDAGRHLGFGPTGSRSIRSAIPENPTLELNRKSIGRPVPDISAFENISEMLHFRNVITGVTTFGSTVRHNF